MAAILLADDDAATRDFVRRALEADGHRVVVAVDGSEALEKVTAGAYQLLVSDVDMPGLDGVTLAAQACARDPALAVLLMSGFTEELARSQGIAARRLGALSKPFTLEQLRASVRKLLA